MNIFHCDHCGQLVFFENVRCLNCNQTLAYLSDLEVVGSLQRRGPDNFWFSPNPQVQGKTYHLCENYPIQDVCNWAVPMEDQDPLCLSCRLTSIIPDLNEPGHKAAWYKLEVAKRRLVYTLIKLHLPILNKEEDPEHGLAFEFKADPKDRKDPEAKPVLTGHANGVITINIAEADDAERERRKQALHEPYRTLLGHFRHEVGHYYWDRLIRDDPPRLDAFRALFGDERADYGESLKKHYENGPQANWQDRFISAYASSHPWEDWAETWAHYLHMTDALETAAACGLSLRPCNPEKPTLRSVPDPMDDKPHSFERLIDSWFPLTYVLNNLNRGLGLPDGYPFVLSTPTLDKLRFIHDTVFGS